ncbi:MAG TPA: hypothetical protein VMB05_01575 [Solirubrobacteraceae bacterium]|nr:hypothetical protein [Solirubrobacteraceae bacterium]
MLIVLTRDAKIMAWAASPDSGAEAWPPLKQLSAGDQRDASQQLSTLLKLVKPHEPLCITGHGNDHEVGDEGRKRADWTWTSPQLAELLGGLVDGYKGPILTEVCSNTLTDFSANLVLALQKLKRLNGVWVYGYGKSVDVTHPFPDPSKLDTNRELTGKQVNF